jgi:hypothetical protein
MELDVEERRRFMKPFTTIASVVFALIAMGHLLRLLFGWEFILDGVSIPQWASAPALVFAAGLALMLWREARK